MKLKLYLLFLVLLSSYAHAQKRCNLVEVDLAQKVRLSSAIVEGRILNSESVWDKERKNIYTIYTIDVSGVFKGNSNAQTKIVVPGGTIGLKKHIFSSSAELEAGNAGIFFLKNLTYPVSGTNLYQLVAESQGFIQYHKDGKSAKGVFETYQDIDSDLRSVIEKETRSTLKRTKPVDWGNVTSHFELDPSRLENQTPNQNRATQPTISGFTPTTVQAGRDVELTITGTGFGSTRGNSYVTFKNANDGGLSYTQPYANQYVSWSDTQIVVKVPGEAGTGSMFIVIKNGNSTTGVLSSPLTVEYAISTFPHTYNSNTYEYNAKLTGNNGIGGYTFKYTSDVPDQAKTYFANAAKAWNCESKVHLLTGDTPSLNTSVASDGENTVDFENLGSGSGVIARAITRLSACTAGDGLNWFVYEIDVEVNANLTYYYGTEGNPGSSELDYYSTILHELGHANQLGHVIDYNKTMYFSLGAGQTKRTIDTSASNGGTYWVDQSAGSSNCGTPNHVKMSCNPTVSLSSSVSSINENETEFTIMVTQNELSSSDVVVSFSYSGTATSDTDYSPVGLISIPVGSLSASATISISNDLIYEANETIVIDISAVNGATEGETQQVSVVLNDDEAIPSVYLIGSTTKTLAENSSSTKSLVVKLTGKAATDTVVVLATTGTAIYETDYTLSASAIAITIPAGSLSTTITFKAIDDLIYEGEETATLSIASVTGGNGVVLHTQSTLLSVTFTILDNESAPSVTLSTNNTTLTEGASTNANLTATLSAISVFNTIVNLGFSGTAVLNSDYNTAGNVTQIVIPAGSLSASISMSVLDDTIYENSETVIIDITSVTNGTENGTQQQTLFINDTSDAPPTVTLSRGSYLIGENGGATTVTATLSTATEAITTVNLGFSGSATGITDYTLNPSIIIPAGSLSASINLSAVNDFIYEGNETVTIDITTVINGTEDGIQQKNVTIAEDETYPTISLATTTSSITESAGSYTITASLSNVSVYDVVFYIIPTGDAQITSDFNAPFEILIPAGSTSVPITVNIIDDNLYENDETIKFDVGNYITNATENGVQQVSTTLINDDFVQPNVSLSTISPSTIAENGGSTAITATLSTANGVPTTVNLGFTGNATLGADYTCASSIIIPAGSLSASAFLTGVNDVLYEPNETATIEIASVTNATANGTQPQPVTITDDDAAAAPTASLSVSTTSVSESATTLPVFTVTLSTVSGFDTLVTFSTGGTAVYNADYTLSPQSVLIPAGSMSGTTTLLINNDALYEISETVNVQINTVTNGTENGTQSQTVTITNDDAIPTVALNVSAPTVSETGVTTATVTATLSEVSGLTAAVAYTYTGTATNGTDYTVSGTSLINAGSLTNTRTLTVTNDALLEGSETVVIDVTGCTRCTENGIQQQTITILDDDLPSVSLNVNTASVGETDTATAVFTATLSTVSIFPTIVNLSLGGTAINNTDYSMSTLSIVIPAGSLSGTATLNSIPDVVIEENETIIVAIVSVVNGFENGIQEQTVTLNDDDLPNVTLSATTATIPENAGAITFTASLSNSCFQDVTVNLSVSGTATPNADYTLPTSLTIPAGSTSASITLSSINDSLDEVNETVIVDIASAINAIVSGTPQQTVTITDDDATPTVSLTTAVTFIPETNGSAAITAKLSAVSGQAVTVNLGLTGTATLNSDYTLATSITIPAGSISASSTLSAVSDFMDEVNETVIIDITSVTNAIESGTQQKTITITDDDGPPTVTLTTGSATITETAGTTTVTATLSAASSQVVTVNLGLTGTATVTSDYTLATSITIPAGSTSGSIVLNSVNNSINEANETVIIDITSVTNGSELGTQQKTITIIDDDTPPTVTLTTGATTMAEASGSALITATLSAASAQAVTVNLGFTGTATLNSDYASAASITIPAGSTSASIILTCTNDTLDEVNETVIIDITSVTNGTELGTQQKTITITDDDAPPTVTLTTAATTIAETSGITTVMATLSAVSGQAVTVNLGLSGTATVNSDYILSTSIIIPAGSLSASNTLISLNDASDEPNELVIIDITTVVNGTESGTQQKVVSIIDDDMARTTASTTTPLNGEHLESNSAITIYPNPGTGVFNIQLPSAMQIEVYTVYGQLLLSKKMDNGLNTLDISEKPAGTYFIRAIENQKVRNFKIIKN